MKAEHVNPQCAASHLSLWCVDADWAHAQVAAFKAGMMPARSARDGGGIQAAGNGITYSNGDSWPNCVVAPDGVAMLSLGGALMKKESKMVDSTSTVMARQAVRSALTDPRVTGMMLMIDSPGGTFDGTGELTADLLTFAKQKPLHAHAEGLMASAAYWAGSAASRITATEGTFIGSIGAFVRLLDTSGAYAAEGIKVIVVSSAPEKAQLADGVPISDEAVARMQGDVDAIHAMFRQRVKASRRLSPTKLDAASTGRVWMAGEAMALDLIDAVESVDDSMRILRDEIDLKAKDRQAKQKRNAVKMDLTRSRL